MLKKKVTKPIRATTEGKSLRVDERLKFPHVIVGRHNGIDIALLIAGKGFYAIDVENKIGCSIEANSFFALTKKLDKLGLKKNEVDPALKGKLVIVLDRYFDGISGTAVTTGRTRFTWIPSWSGRRAHGENQAEVVLDDVKKGAERTQWVNCDRLAVSTRREASSLKKKLAKAAKSENESQSATRKLEKILRDLPRLKVML